MALIKCSHPDCPLFISDPCPPVVILFGIKVYLEDMLINLTADTPLYQKTASQLTQVNSQIETSGLQDEATHYEQFRQTAGVRVIKTQFKVNKPVTVQKTFYLECGNKHRNNYIVDCPA